MNEIIILFIKINLSFLFSWKARNGCMRVCVCVCERETDRQTDREIRDWGVPDFIDTALGTDIQTVTYSLTGGLIQNRFFVTSPHPAGVYSLVALRISGHYIIFSTLTHFPSGSQITWFISAVPLFTRVHILFRNPHLTCCQRSICNIKTAPKNNKWFLLNWIVLNCLK